VRNSDTWKPTKYVYKNAALVASRDRDEVFVGSRLIADLVAGLYDRNLRLHARGRLLDLGCGKVPLFLAYKEHVTHVTCVDWENSLHKNEYIDAECDLTRKLPFQDAEFDTIILSDVLEHIPEPRGLWSEMARVLSSGGKIVMNVPFYYWIHESPHDYYRYTEFSLRKFAEESGFKLIYISSVGGAPEVLTDVLAKTVILSPVLGHSLSVFIQFVSTVFLKTRFGRKLSNKTKETFPLGYFLVVEKL
jgi:SAM-dependent methyltransferase